MSIPDNINNAGPVTQPAQPYGFLGLILSLAGMALGCVALIAAAAGLWVAFAGLDEVNRSIAAFAAVEINDLRKAPHATQMVFYSVTAVTFIALGLSVLAFARLRGGAQWRAPLAWETASGWPRGRGLWLLVAFALAYLLAVGYGVKLIHPQFRTWFFVPDGPSGIILSFVTVVILAPWAEELLFRGWIYSSLRRSFGIAAGLGITTILFALAHLDPTRLYPVLIFIPGLILTLIREKNGSARASFYAHAAYNALAWLIVFFLGNS